MDADCENRRSAAAYIRVSSSGNPAQLSVASQMQAIKQYAENNGAHVTDWYVDEGDSGTSMERPALKELLAAADADEKSFGDGAGVEMVPAEPQRRGFSSHEAVARGVRNRARFGLRIR